MSSDEHFMGEAIRLARRGRGVASPNPNVGAVIVNDGDVVGRGWHRGVGTDHAEVIALKEAGDRARGATVYLPLEPCVHHGNTPPCTEALLAAGIGRAVISMEDPDIRVAGKGITALKEAGVEVDVGIRSDEAAGVNEAYLVHRRTARPLVVVKMAMSADGGVAAADGSSRWISSEVSRADVHRLRADADAVCVGIGTVLADDPSLTAREPGVQKQPLRVVVDSSGRTPADAKVLQGDPETLIVTTKHLPSPLTDRSHVVGAKEGKVDLGEMMDELGHRGITSLVVEGGPRLVGALLAEGLADKLVIYLAPKLLGEGSLRAIGGWSSASIDGAIGLEIISVKKMGPDVKLVAKPKENR